MEELETQEEKKKRMTVLLLASIHVQFTFHEQVHR